MKQALLIIMLTVSACAGGDPASSCRPVCDARHNCVDSTVVPGICEDACLARQSDDAEYEQRVDACNACISERTCAEFLADCGAVCEGIPD